MIPQFRTADVLAARPPKSVVDPWRPYAYLVEDERTAAGLIEPVATLFLTNRECPFHCIYCDLWRHTLDEPTPLGAIPKQIVWALSQLPPSRHIKLYNSGNFFDPLAIPPDDYAAIAALVEPFETVIVENHPRLCTQRVLDFQRELRGKLEVSLGLETVHPEILPRLNKQMTVADYEQAARFLTDHGIAVRTFILLRPPGLSEDEGVHWAIRSLDAAFQAGSRCCSVIPVRAGNGILDRGLAAGWFTPPSLRSLYDVQAQGLSWQRGRIFVDLWDAARFASCAVCASRQIDCLQRMNLTQQVEPWPECDCER